MNFSARICVVGSYGTLRCFSLSFFVVLQFRRDLLFFLANSMNTRQNTQLKWISQRYGNRARNHCDRRNFADVGEKILTSFDRLVSGHETRRVLFESFPHFASKVNRESLWKSYDWAVGKFVSCSPPKFQFHFWLRIFAREKIKDIECFYFGSDIVELSTRIVSHTSFNLRRIDRSLDRKINLQTDRKRCDEVFDEYIRGVRLGYMSQSSKKNRLVQ